MGHLKKELLKQLEHSFDDQSLFEQALTHSSVQRASSYERLEFLGDRILGLIIAETLYFRFPDEAEGDLAKRFTQLVSRPMLVEIANKLNFSEILSFSGKHSVTDSVLADVCESLIAALYLDGGLKTAQTFVLKYWGPHLEKDQAPPEDSKTQLQEWAQANYKETPVYTVINQSGTAHAPLFTIKVSLSKGQSAEGQGTSKRQAEHAAATALLRKILMRK